MATIFQDNEDKYSIQTADQPILIEVTIGNGQTGAYVIFLGKELKGTNTTANLGTKSTVAGRTGIISTTITDTLEETNFTSVIVTVVEGTKRTDFGPYTRQAPNDTDTVLYNLKLRFS